MALRIRPVKLKQSIYLRVPSNIVDLIGMDGDAEVTMTLGEQDDQFILSYQVAKSKLQRLSSQVQVVQSSGAEELAALNGGQHSDDH
jgi:hypothetical protein